jgi:hypothetical protein
VCDVAAAEIFVCRLSQSVVVHLTWIPVVAVNRASAAAGGGGFNHATVIVTPLVWFDPADDPEPEHPLASNASATAPETRADALRPFRLCAIP